MKKNVFILLILISVLLFGCSRENFSKKQEEPVIKDKFEIEQNLDYKNEEAQAIENVFEIEKVSLIIDFGSGEIRRREVEFKEEMTVFDLLQKGAEEQGLVLETRNYSLGVFIETIGNKKNGSDNKYWTYYVNDKFAQVAGDKVKLKAGDKVKWKFGEASF